MRTFQQSLKLIELGQGIKSTRLAHGYTQTELAYILGKKQPMINRLESGKVNPGYLFLAEIADALNIHPSELLP